VLIAPLLFFFFSEMIRFQVVRGKGFVFQLYEEFSLSFKRTQQRKHEKTDGQKADERRRLFVFFSNPTRDAFWSSEQRQRRQQRRVRYKENELL